MQFFKKVGESAKSLAKQVVANVKATAAELSSSQNVPTDPKKEIVVIFKSICEIVDMLAASSHATSVEADMQLHESKIRSQFKTLVQILQVESDSWRHYQAAQLDTDNSITPCLDIFLQQHMIQEFVNRCVNDLPRGCMPLMLGMISNLLRSVSYPLLPHQSVHKPVGKLISIAMRYEAIHNSNLLQGIQFTRIENASYRRRIETGLTALLRTIWRKVAENPPVLDFFTFSDRRLLAGGRSRSQEEDTTATATSSTATASVGSRSTTHMDIMTALIALIHRPKVALYAQEALIMALSLRDPRIEVFILQSTKLFPILIQDVCRKYHAVVENMLEIGTTVQIMNNLQQLSYTMSNIVSGSHPTAVSKATPGHKPHSASVGKPPLGNVGGAVAHAGGRSAAKESTNLHEYHEEVITALEAFARSLRLFAAVFVTVSKPVNNSVSYNKNRSVDWENEENPLTSSEVMVDSYISYFLRGCLETTLRVNSEINALISEILLIRTIQELSKFNYEEQPTMSLWKKDRQQQATHSIDLLQITVQFVMGTLDINSYLRPSTGSAPPKAELLVRAEEYIPLFVARMGSISKPVAIVSYELFGLLLSKAPLADAIQLYLTPPVLKDDAGAEMPTAVSSSPVPHSNSSWFTADGLNSLETLVSQLYSSVMVNIYVPLEQELTTVSIASANVTPQKVAASPSRECYSSNFQGLVDNYISNAANHILLRMSGKLSTIMDTVNGLPSAEATRILDDTSGRNLSIDLVMKKISGFLSLKSEERIAVSSMVQQCMALMSIVIITSTVSSSSAGNSSPQSVVEEAIGLAQLNKIQEMLRCIDFVWRDIKTHVARVPNYAYKIILIRNYLESNAMHILAASLPPEDSKHSSNSNAIGAAVDKTPQPSPPAPPSTMERRSSFAASFYLSPSNASSNSSLNTSSHGSSHGAAVITPPPSSHGTSAVKPRGTLTDLEIRKMLDKETPQARQILESLVFVYELYLEMRAYCVAIKLLRNEIVGNASIMKLHSAVVDGQSRSTFGSTVDLMNASDIDFTPPLVEELCIDYAKDDTEESAEDAYDIQSMHYLLISVNNNTASMHGGVKSLSFMPQFSFLSAGNTATGTGSKGGLHQYKRSMFWGQLETKEQDFLSEYTVLERSLDELIACN